MIHNQNEIYLDIVEEVDSTLSVNGTIVSSEVSGVILGNSKLSGVPDLALQFLDPSLIDDCSFHPCVRYNRFERDRVVSFVPPDGTFELMKYRVNTSSGHTVAPCYVQPAVSYDYEGRKGSIALIVGTRSSSSLLFPNSRLVYFKTPNSISMTPSLSPYGAKSKRTNLTHIILLSLSLSLVSGLWSLTSFTSNDYILNLSLMYAIVELLQLFLLKMSLSKFLSLNMFVRQI